jgi:hypothetical protein
MATAKAMGECEIMRLEKSAIISILHKEPAFSEKFVSHLLTRTIRVEEDLVDQLFNSSEKRCGGHFPWFLYLANSRLSAMRPRKLRWKKLNEREQ